MIESALRGSFSGVIACSACGLAVPGSAPASGWQDKSAAHGRAHVVGWVRFFGHCSHRACWRLPQKSERFQSLKRQRTCFKPSLVLMTTRDDELNIQPGRIQHGGEARSVRRASSVK